MITFSNKTILASSIFHSQGLSVRSNVRIESSASAIWIHSFTLLKAIVGSVLEIDASVMVQLSGILNQKRIAGFGSGCGMTLVSRLALVPSLVTVSAVVRLGMTR